MDDTTPADPQLAYRRAVACGIGEGWHPIFQNSLVRLAMRMADVGAVKTGGPFKLAKGGESDHYFDVKRVLLDAAGLHHASYCVVNRLADYPAVVSVGGPELGVIPLVGGVLSYWHVVRKTGHANALTGFMVRKAPKTHGTTQRIEGRVEAGDVVALVEDVTTTAGSVVEAMEQVEAAGARVALVFVVVNRGGDLARQAVESRGSKFFPMLDSEAVLKFVRG